MLRLGGVWCLLGPTVFCVRVAGSAFRGITGLCLWGLPWRGGGRCFDSCWNLGARGCTGVCVGDTYGVLTVWAPFAFFGTSFCIVERGAILLSGSLLCLRNFFVGVVIYFVFLGVFTFY